MTAISEHSKPCGIYCYSVNCVTYVKIYSECLKEGKKIDRFRECLFA